MSTLNSGNQLVTLEMQLLSCPSEMLRKPRKRQKPTIEADKSLTPILEKFLTISLRGSALGKKKDQWSGPTRCMKTAKSCAPEKAGRFFMPPPGSEKQGLHQPKHLGDSPLLQRFFSFQEPKCSSVLHTV